MTRHLTRDELQRWWTHGAPEDRDRIVGHLAECDACGALYAEVIDAQPVTPLAQPADARLQARAYRIHSTPGHAPAVWWWWPRAALVAAAATFLLAIAVPWFRWSGPVSWRDGGIRGSTLQPVSPIGTVEPPVRFAWTSPVRASRYEVEVRTSDGRLVARFSTTREQLELTPTEQQRLEPGRRYTWIVAAFVADGEPMLRTPAREFVIAPAR